MDSTPLLAGEALSGHTAGLLQLLLQLAQPVASEAAARLLLTLAMQVRVGAQVAVPLQSECVLIRPRFQLSRMRAGQLHSLSPIQRPMLRTTMMRLY